MLKDSRSRFQNSRFKHRLLEARGYKRPVRGKPSGAVGIFLSKIGMGSWLSQFITLLVFLFLIYLTFVPNFFFVKYITINNSQIDDKSTIEILVNSYLSKKLPWPQKNLVLLSKTGLKNFLLKNDQKILSINAINKKFPSTLILNINPRFDKFVIQTSDNNDFLVSNDGLITGEIFLTASQTLPNALIPIKLPYSDGLIIGRQAFNQTQIAFINQSQSQLPDIAKSPIDYYELTALEIPDITVYFKTGPKIYFSVNADSTRALNRLKLLFFQFKDLEIKKIQYIDMRFGDNGYVCLKGTACVQDINLPAASTTPVN